MASFLLSIAPMIDCSFRFVPSYSNSYLIFPLQNELCDSFNHHFNIIYRELMKRLTALDISIVYTSFFEGSALVCFSPGPLSNWGPASIPLQGHGTCGCISSSFSYMNPFGIFTALCTGAGACRERGAERRTSDSSLDTHLTINKIKTKKPLMSYRRSHACVCPRTHASIFCIH